MELEDGTVTELTLLYTLKNYVLSIDDVQISIKEEAEKNKDYSEEGVKEILVKAAYRTKATGSSTCCLILLDINSYKIFSANIGDSGYLIIRNEEGKLVEYYKSEEQQHSFNFPFQVVISL
jgi:protein phosphatase PTC7